MRVVVLLALLAAAVCGEKARFDHYTVHRVTPSTEQQVDVLRELQARPDGMDFWTDVVVLGRDVDIMVPPHKTAHFQQIMHNFQLTSKVFIDNVQERIDNEKPSAEQKAFGWTAYYRLDDIYEWYDSLAANYSEVSVEVAGTSHEGRELRAVKIEYNVDNPVIFIEGGIHAREWISPATVTFMLNELLNGEDPEVRRIAEAFTWYIVASVNPDGYEYTHTTNRNWRKTRRPNEGSLCFGADPNRNFPGELWGEAPGASDQPCSETYSGPSPFSEIEMRTLSEYIASKADKMEAYINFHSYSQILLLPLGHTIDPVPNYSELMRIGNRAATALASRFGTAYEVGNVMEILYPCHGLSMDWVYTQLSVPIVYSFELRDKGSFGFFLPPSQIIPSGLETLDALVSIAGDVLDSLPTKMAGV